MTVNSLANFGVPGYNGDRSPVLAPIFTNRFRVTFYNFGSTFEPGPYSLTRQLNKITRPNVTFDAQTLYSYVSTIYVVNRGEWNEMSVSFYDDIYNEVTNRIQNQVAKQMNFFDQTASRAGENYKFEMDLDVLAGGASAGGTNDPNIIQKWCYAGCSIVGTDLGEFNYKNQEAMEVGCTIRYDNVIGFDHNGRQMGTFSHTPEIQGRLGGMATGVGVPASGMFGSGISLLNAAVGAATVLSNL